MLINEFPPADLESRPKLKTTSVLRKIGKESIAWASRAVHPVLLDDAATLLSGIFDGEATLGELIDDVCEVIGVETNVAEAQVQRTLSLLSQGGLLETDSTTNDAWRLERNLLPEPDW